ncbi:YeiH family protein [Reinekea sp.]|jgi:uncharacterized integral membrane protein (TIGR00698 family)|uniref:YeiH family protein n=1 Tax=Reinekea sp. TaxID=1970455 RepID=UPI00398A426A
MWIALPIISLVAFMSARTEFAQHNGIGALPLAIVLGIIVGNLLANQPVTARSLAILEFSKKKLLRAGIILFGSHLTLTQLAAVGWQAAILDMLVISTVLSVGYILGVRMLGMGREETILISVGSAVCGAAAILATEPVLKAKQQDVSVAVATVVVFGTLALFCYPFIFHISQLSSESFGIYIGSTVHEVAQAVAAGQAIDMQAMNNAVVVKLMRVMMLAPVVIIIAALYQRKNTATQTSTAQAIPWPWFVFGFIAMVIFNSLFNLPEPVVSTLQISAQLLLTIAMTALGLQTKFSAVKAAGTKPLLLSATLFSLLLGGGFMAHQLLY